MLNTFRFWLTISGIYGSHLLWENVRDSTETHKRQRLEQLFLLLLLTTFFLLLEAFVRSQSLLLNFADVTLREKIYITRCYSSFWSRTFHTITLCFTPQRKANSIGISTRAIIFACFKRLILLNINSTSRYRLTSRLRLCPTYNLSNLPNLHSFNNLSRFTRAVGFFANQIFNRQGSVLLNTIKDLDKRSQR